MANQIIHNCIKCNKTRLISKLMFYLIKNNKSSGKCLSCANRDRVRTVDYDLSLYQKPLYRSWFNMKTRCTNKKTKEWNRYGGRGISYDKKWEKFSGFLQDMGGSFQDGLSLDRIDNNGNYCKKNCRWATQTEQANNTKHTEIARKYIYKGQAKRISEWAKEYNLKRTTLDMRLRHYKIPIEIALIK